MVICSTGLLALPSGCILQGAAALRFHGRLVLLPHLMLALQLHLLPLYLYPVVMLALLLPELGKVLKLMLGPLRLPIGLIQPILLLARVIGLRSSKVE